MMATRIISGLSPLTHNGILEPDNNNASNKKIQLEPAVAFVSGAGGGRVGTDQRGGLPAHNEQRSATGRGSRRSRGDAGTRAVGRERRLQRAPVPADRRQRTSA